MQTRKFVPAILAGLLVFGGVACSDDGDDDLIEGDDELIDGDDDLVEGDDELTDGDDDLVEGDDEMTDEEMTDEEE